MMADWAGLWHHDPSGTWRDEVPSHVAVYLLAPLAIALMFARKNIADSIIDGYPRAFVISACVGGCFELAYRLAWPLLIRRKPGWPLRVAGHAITIAAGALVGGTVAASLLELVWGVPADEMRGVLWRQATIVSTVIIGILVTTDELAARARAHEQRAAELRVTALRAELAALQARTDPHFLFNSLNTVAALIPDEPALAEAALERLAVVFRYALDAGRRDRVPLADELAAVTSYLEVEALRLGSRLTWRIDRDGGIDDARVPPLVLQPLAENAIRHGAGSRLGATDVVIRAVRDGARLRLTVDDQPLGPQRGTAARPTLSAARFAPGAGIALAELEKRLALAFGSAASMTAGPHGDGWRVEVEMPCGNP
jgi:two-component system sensor histidine kinase AlgZ